LRTRKHLLFDIGSVYGAQMAYYVVPLVTVPYLSRVLGPASWGLLAMAQAFALYGALIVDYGFIFSASRQIIAASTDREVESVIAGVLGAKLLLAAAVAIAAVMAYQLVPLFHEHPRLFTAAVCSEVVRALLPTFYFFGVRRVAFSSMLDILSRLAAAIGIFAWVHQPRDTWKVFALQGLGGLIAFAIGTSVMYSRYGFLWPGLGRSIRALREGGAMFLFRSAYHIFSLGNAFILGLFAPAQDVGYYAGAEKINSAAVGLLSPLSTALYPHSTAMIKQSFSQAVRLTRTSLYVMGAVAVALMLFMWVAATPVVSIILGPNYRPSAAVFRILSLRAPMLAWTNVLGFQWLLALGLEKSFQQVTVVALVINFSLAAILAPRFSFIGMGWAVVASQAAMVIGVYVVVRRRNLNPLAIASGAGRV
jgi:PST family polysaccharide transporter